jgi:hypothetical protein
MPYQASDIVSHWFKTDGAISDSCASVSIQIDTNDLVVESERGRKSSEHLKGSKATVKHVLAGFGGLAARPAGSVA